MTSIQALALTALLVFGLVQTFFGYRLFRILVGVIGALIGFFYAPQFFALVTGEMPAAALSIAIGAGLAVAFALIAWYVFRIAAFAWGATLGYAALVAAFAAPPWLALLIGLAVGALALLFQRVLIVLLTAVNGAWLVVSVIAFFLGQVASPPRGLAFDPMFDTGRPVSMLLFSIVLVLAAAGSIYQFRDARPMLGRKIGAKSR